MAILRSDTISGIGTEGPVFDGGLHFRSENYLTLPKGDTSQRGRGRGLWGGGTISPASDIIQYAELSTTGNTTDFGNLSTANQAAAALSSSTRCCFGGGNNNPSYFNKIEFVTIATTSNVTDFGDLAEVKSGASGCGNETRGIFGPGFSPTPTNRNVNTIEFITIATTGNATDFGDFTEDIRGIAALSSPTRGIFAGGYTPSSPNVSNTIQYITIATTGNAQDFGDTSFARMNLAGGGCSNGTRGLFAGGRGNPVTGYNIIDFVTISSTGNALDFGDLTVTGQGVGANSNSIRGVFGGRTNPSKQQVIDYVEIATTGNAKDFGDLLNTFANCAGTSDSHGGLAE